MKVLKVFFLIVLVGVMASPEIEKRNAAYNVCLQSCWGICDVADLFDSASTKACKDECYPKCEWTKGCELPLGVSDISIKKIRREPTAFVGVDQATDTIMQLKVYGKRVRLDVGISDD